MSQLMILLRSMMSHLSELLLAWDHAIRSVCRPRLRWRTNTTHKKRLNPGHHHTDEHGDGGDDDDTDDDGQVGDEEDA